MAKDQTSTPVAAPEKANDANPEAFSVNNVDRIAFFAKMPGADLSVAVPGGSLTVRVNQKQMTELLKEAKGAIASVVLEPPSVVLETSK